MMDDCCEFSKLYFKKTGKRPTGQIDRKFITKMVMDELQELQEAKDQTEEVDALLDAVYYILQHLCNLEIDLAPVWMMIHTANMTKFEKGYLGPDGKWNKPSDFQPPDDRIRDYLSNPIPKTV
jgi:predicted HAD superfamily Cof-like phosphohydrolase